MSKKQDLPQYHFLTSNKKELLKKENSEKWISALRSMMTIRNFEIRAEAAYQMGKVGGFFHSYIGQEAIQASCVSALGTNPWYATTYRCHALALLLGVTPKEAMAELYGKETGNAKGRGGSMHMYTDKLLGGFGIVGGHLPIAIGAAFSLKYKKQKSLSLCFLGDGAVAQGLFHESLNLASLWDLPTLFVIENNQWGMGTAVSRAICTKPMAESFAKAYNMAGYTVNGMDFLDCYHFFETIGKQMILDNRPVIVEMITERFKGHSVSDPALYRSKECLQKAMQKDPIHLFAEELKKANLLTDEEMQRIDKEEKEKVLEAMKFAEESPDPDFSTLEEGVFAKDEK